MIDETKLFAFDLDGTLYLGEELISGATEIVGYLRERYHVVYFTNNSSRTKEEVYVKLNKLGLQCQMGELYTSSSCTAQYLKESNIDNLYMIGSESFRIELIQNGLRIIDDDSAENLVVGLDRDFNYGKIATALAVLLNGGKFIVCNEDRYFPVGENEFMPACGAMVGAIATASNRRPDFIVGKPNTYILSQIAHAFHVQHNEILVIGDSYESDIMMALNFNSKAILINSEYQVPQEQVLVQDNLHALLHFLKEHCNECFRI